MFSASINKNFKYILHYFMAYNPVNTITAIILVVSQSLPSYWIIPDFLAEQHE